MYEWAILPVVAGCLLLCLIVRPAVGEGTRTLDAALGAVLAASALQLVPLPAAAAQIVSPARVRVHEALRLGASPSWLPLSIEPSATVVALLLLAGTFVMYLAARRVFETGGVRLVCRGVGWMGLVLACVAMVQRGASSGRIYGFWTPLDTGALPYGPFVNRNHCATWLLMSIPVCFGYLMARLANERAPSEAPEGSRPKAGRRASASGGGAPRALRNGRSESLRHTFDGRTVWLATAGTAMVLALAWSFSRSGIAAFAVSSIVVVGATRARMDPLRTVWVAGLVVLGLAAVITLADVGAVLDRFADGIGASRLGRLAIWRDTLPVIADFFVTGSGIGTYQTAMLIYQTGDRTYYYNQAHNEILQVASEGGLLIVLPAAIALAAFVGVAARRLKADGTGIFWIRAGAAAGLAGVALQSVWETGLRVPANALFAAVLAAILTHQQRESIARRPGRRP